MTTRFIEKDRLLEFLQNERHVKYMLKLFVGAARSGKINKSDFKKWVVSLLFEFGFNSNSLG